MLVKISFIFVFLFNHILASCLSSTLLVLLNKFMPLFASSWRLEIVRDCDSIFSFPYPTSQVLSLIVRVASFSLIAFKQSIKFYKVLRLKRFFLAHFPFTLTPSLRSHPFLSKGKQRSSRQTKFINRASKFTRNLQW